MLIENSKKRNAVILAVVGMASCHPDLLLMYVQIECVGKMPTRQPAGSQRYLLKTVINSQNTYGN